MGDQPSYHDGDEYEEQYGDRDWYGEDEGEGGGKSEVDVETAAEPPEYLKHIVGSVYWDSRTRYSIVELPLVAIVLMPTEMFGRLFRPVLQWLLETDVQAFIWVAQNYQTAAFIAFFVVFFSRLTLADDHS